MGVPSYFHWLVSKFQNEILKGLKYRDDPAIGQQNNEDKQNVKEVELIRSNDSLSLEEDLDLSVDNLYLDLNCAIHPAVKVAGLSRDKMYPAVGEYLNNIVKTANPEKVIYIAIDGVAPCAKMQQQRKRRYKSVQDKKLTDKIKKKHGVPIESTEDFNMISPGTKFMEDLSLYLKKTIQGWKNSTGAKYKHWQQVKIIFSDATVPGEGEHKIMDHIRDHTTAKDNIVVYGLDSDLIFLCLCNYRPNMYLLREKIHFGPKYKCSTREGIEFVYMSIDKLRECLLKILNPYVSLRELENFKIFGDSKYDTYTKTEDVEKEFMGHCQEMLAKKFYTTKEEEQNLIMDYVFMSFMLGNDFLGPLASLKIKDGGLDQLLRVYKMVQLHKKSYLLSRDERSKSQIGGYFKVNMDFFRDLLYQLTILEDAMLQKQTQMRHYRVNNFYKGRDYTMADDYHREILELEYIENKITDKIRIGYSGWKDRYYSTHFNIENRNFYEFTKNVQVICRNYLEGMIWTLHYYQRSCDNWNWSYDYHSSPAVSDLYESLQKIDPNTITFKKNGPVTPFEQLMTILPPASAHLLPVPYGRLMTRTDSPIIYFYPIDFELDMLNGRFRWECHPLLPKIDSQRLKQAMKNVEKYLSQSEINRNTNKDEILL